MWRHAVVAVFLCVVAITFADDQSSGAIVDPASAKGLEDLDAILKLAKEAAQGETKGDDDIANWQVPEELERAYPYYLSGYDDEDRPIWITEFGKFKISHFISQGPEKVEEFEKYVKKAADRVIKSLSSKNKEGKELVAIIDFEDLPFNVFSQVPTLRLLLKLAREYRKLLEDHVHHAFVINASYPAVSLINFVRPLLGNLLENVEVYGENKNKWQPAILRFIPQDQLPQWYGGVKGHVPLKVYG